MNEDQPHQSSLTRVAGSMSRALATFSIVEGCAPSPCSIRQTVLVETPARAASARKVRSFNFRALRISSTFTSMPFFIPILLYTRDFFKTKTKKGVRMYLQSSNKMVVYGGQVKAPAVQEHPRARTKGKGPNG